MAYSVLHLVAFAGIILGWLLCTIVSSPYFITVKEEYQVGQSALPLIEHFVRDMNYAGKLDLSLIEHFGRDIKIKLSESEMLFGVWVSFWEISVEAGSDGKKETRYIPIYYEPPTDSGYFRAIMSQLYSVFHVTVGLWSIIAGLLDSIYFRGRSTTSVGIGALMAALAGPAVCIFSMSSRLTPLLEPSGGFFVYIVGFIIMAVSASGLVVLPPPKPLEYEDTKPQAA